MSQLPGVRLEASGCVTALGDAAATHAALLRGEVALRAQPVLGGDGGEGVPLALISGRSLDETVPPNWLATVKAMAATMPGEGWGGARRPVFVTSSNFGVGNLYAYRRHGDARHLRFGTPHLCVEWLARELGWGANVTTARYGA